MTATTLSASFQMFCLSILCLFIFGAAVDANAVAEDQGDHLLYEALLDVTGPTSFPKPTDLTHRDVIPIVKPDHGHHRPDQDAVFAYFEGYSIKYFLHFVESLYSTAGFTGDLVVAIAAPNLLSDDVWEYLTSKLYVVIYYAKMDCYDDEMRHIVPRKVRDHGSFDVFQACQLNHVYGYNHNKTIVPDPRPGRVVATLRYEWYWIWLQHYQPHKWILLVDARDSFFQVNPFADLPRQSLSSAKSGQLFFYGENTEATRLGKSPKNINWLKQAYGPEFLNVVRDKAVLCSGSSMGEVVAMEQYLRAMVQETDETKLHMTGADQGFHNYLFYSGKLQNVQSISSLTVFRQGHGHVNHLGALRDKPLVEWGVYNLTTKLVTNWDGSISPVVHQWDRDHDLHKHRFRWKFRDLVNEWNKKKEQWGLVRRKSAAVLRGETGATQ